jgi:hypothetical protein
VKLRPNKHSKNTILIVEEAVHFLRLAPAGLLLSYYVGSLPFILGLLFFWADMSRHGYASDHLYVGSLGVALLFVWMKSWHAVFGLQIRLRLSGTTWHPLPVQRYLSIVASQTLIHSTGLLVLPLAALMLVPFGWCYAFYQNAAMQAHGDSLNFRDMSRNAWQQAKLWPMQNHLLLIIFFFFGLVVLFNVSIAILILPYILKKFAGVETVFTLSGLHALNTTFLVSAFAISYLCLDPLIKIAYALRCFYGEALTTGADLKTELNIFRAKRKMLALVLVVMLLAPVLKVHGSEQLELLPAEAPGISSTELDHAIDAVLERREFVWRLPKKKPPVEESTDSGPLISVLRWILEKVENAFKIVSGWLENLVDWLDKMWPRENTPETSADRDWRPAIRYLLIALSAVLAVILLMYVVKFWRRRPASQEESDSDAGEQTPDLRDDGIKADELPANRWLDLAKELMAKGDYRLAMRALYLATLSCLAEKELVHIEIYKSNRDYDRELQRRSTDRKDLIATFSETVTVIDRVWYGMRKISQHDVERYLAEQERIMALAEK